jgi:hypothetical protein
MWLFRPLMSDPPLVTAEGLARLTLCQIADLHEIMDLKAEVMWRAEQRAKRK